MGSAAALGWVDGWARGLHTIFRHIKWPIFLLFVGLVIRVRPFRPTPIATSCIKNSPVEPMYISGVNGLALHCFDKLLLSPESILIKVFPVTLGKGRRNLLIARILAPRLADLINIVRTEVNGAV